MTLATSLRLEAEQLPDAVILVDDVVAGAQVGERLERAAEARVGARRALAEDLRVRGSSASPRLAPDEAAAGRRDDEARPRPPSAGRRRDRRRPRPRPAELGWARSASPRCGKATSTRRPPRRRAAASSFSASARPRAVSAGRCASNEWCWPLRERVELGDARRRAGARRPSSLAARPSRTSSACQHEVGAAGGAAARDRPGRGPCGARRPVLASGGSVRSGRALGRRVDERLVEGAQRALRERREGAHGLDLVAEELDAERLAAGRREDVDDAAADGELPALLDLVDALVAGERRAARRARRCPARRRGGARPARGRASGGGAPSASASADTKTSPPAASTSSARARSPTRCGGGSRPDSQRTPRLGSRPTRSVAEEPGGGLGGVARVGVVGQDDEPAVELHVERRRNERQRRLGDPRAASRQVRGEAAEAFVLGELARERREDRRVCCQRLLVHDDGPARPGDPIVVRRRCPGTRRRRARAGRRR